MAMVDVCLKNDAAPGSHPHHSEPEHAWLSQNEQRGQSIPVRIAAVRESVVIKGITGSRSRPRSRGPRRSAARATSRSSRTATADAYANADRPQLLIGPPRLSGSGRRTVTLSSNRYGCARMTPARRRCNQDISARTMFSSSPATASRRGSGPRVISQNSESRRRRSSSAASIAGCAPLARDPRQGCADAVRIRRSGPEGRASVLAPLIVASYTAAITCA